MGSLREKQAISTLLRIHWKYCLSPAGKRFKAPLPPAFTQRTSETPTCVFALLQIETLGLSDMLYVLTGFLGPGVCSLNE